MGGGGGGGSIKTFRDILNILPTSFSRPALYVTAFFFFFPPLNLSPKCENRPGKTQALELGSSIIGSHFWPQLQGQDTSRLLGFAKTNHNRATTLEPDPMQLGFERYVMFVCLFVCLFICSSRLTWTCYTHPTIHSRRTATTRGTSSPTLLE